MQIFAIVVSFALTIAAVALLVPAVRRMLGVIRSGQPAPGRTGNPTGRAVTMLKETFLHTRMLQWHWVGVMHWFVYMGFLLLSTAVLAAYFQLFKPDFAYPVIGHWYPFEWLMELIGALSTVAGMFINSRIPKLTMTVGYDPRFSHGDYGIFVRCAPERAADAEQVLRSHAPVEVRSER